MTKDRSDDTIKENISQEEERMKKTKLGISANLLAAILCLSPFVGGYTVMFGLALYVLLAEKDEWLKKTAVKTLVIVFIFGAIDVALDLIPGAISVISSIFELFNRPFHMNFVTNLVYTVENILSFFRNILLIAMSVMALAKNAPEFGPVDDMVKKHTTDLEDED